MMASEAQTNGLHSTNATDISPVNETVPAQSNVSLLEELQVPFGTDLVRWRAHETRKVQGGMEGYFLPYADSRAYMDRLNLLLTAAGWTERYSVATTSTKILVACQLTISGLGCHSSTGEEWARSENALTAAQAQAFKRACSGFGLGRYLYDFQGVWLEIDREKRPKSLPPIPEWATPEGWRRGLRPPLPALNFSHNEQCSKEQQSSVEQAGGPGHNGRNVVREIQRMEPKLGKTLYRGLLRDMARVWRP